MSTNIGHWVGAIFSLALLSYLFKENAVFRLAEHIFVGMSSAHIVVTSWHNYLRGVVMEQIPAGQYILILPIVVGLLMYTRYLPKVAWVARIPLSIWVGYGTGYVLAYTPKPFLTQIRASFVKFVATNPDGAFWAGKTINNVVFFLFLVGTMMYFFFTIKRDNPVIATGASIGRWAIMIAMGAAFGNTVMARTSLFVGRLNFLLGDWLGIMKK
ncbi:MAG: hypothetical protein AB1331_02920 [Bacillota bacterium]